MSVKAAALLRVPIAALSQHIALADSVTFTGADAVFVGTNRTYDTTPIDEIALALRRNLGRSLDLHDDPRGILLFPETVEPKAAGYDDLVAQIGGDATPPRGLALTTAPAYGAQGVAWVPKVSKDHIPLVWSTAPAGAIEALIHQTVRYERDAGLPEHSLHALLRRLQAGALAAAFRVGRECYEPDPELLGRLGAALGDDFVKELRAALQRIVRGER